MTDDLAANYARAYNRRVGFGARPALILIDFCMGYFDPACELHAGVEDALASALRLRTAARAANIPVILTNVVYHPSAIDGGRFFEKAAPLKHFLQGSPMGAFAPGLTPHADELVISKQYPSAFFGTSLSSMLRAQGVDCLLLAGMSTSGCVRASGVDAMQHGFIPVVVSDACGDRHPSPHEANLFDLAAKYADVRTLAQVRADLA